MAKKGKQKRARERAHRQFADTVYTPQESGRNTNGLTAQLTAHQAPGEQAKVSTLSPTAEVVELLPLKSQPSKALGTPL